MMLVTMRGGRGRLAVAMVLCGCAAQPVASVEHAPAATGSAAASAATGTASAPAVASASAAAVSVPVETAAEARRRWALAYVGKLSGDGLALWVFREKTLAELKALRAQYEGECKGGELTACTAAAALAEQVGEGAEAVAPVYVKACKGGELIACARLALFWPCHHPDREVRLTHRMKCDGLGGLPGFLEGEGVGVDKQRPALAGARALGARACEGGVAPGCAAVGASFEVGTGDAKKAVALYVRGCELGSWMACSRAFAVGKDEAAARRQLALATAACERGDGTGCAYAGSQHDAGTGVPRDKAQARALYKRGCEAGVTYACDDLARVDGEK